METGQVWFKFIGDLESGNFYRYRRDLKYSHYESGEFVGVVERIPETYCHTLKINEANKHLPANCRI